MSTFGDAVKELKELRGKIALNQRQAGRIILDYLGESKKPMREKMLRKLCKAVGIDRATAYRWMQAWRDFEKLPGPVVERAEKAFKKITKPIRETLLEVRAANPDATPQKIVELTKSELEPKHAVEKDTPTARERQEKLFRFAQKLYWNVNPAQRDRELRELADSLIDLFRLDGPEKSEVA